MAVGKKQGFKLKDFNEMQKSSTAKAKPKCKSVQRFSNICRKSSHFRRTIVRPYAYFLTYEIGSLECQNRASSTRHVAEK